MHDKPRRAPAHIAAGKTSPLEAYLSLERKFTHCAVIKNISGLLYWDMATTMPEGAAESRGRQLGTLSRIAHEQLVSNQTVDLLHHATQDKGELNEWQSANLREMRHAYAHASALPADLVEARAKIISKTERAWMGARRNDDFAFVLPFLEEALGIEKETGQAKAEALGLNLYDALIDAYNPGARQAKIDPLFDNLQKKLPSLVTQALEKQDAAPKAELPQGPFPIDTQKQLARKLAEAIGFDFSRGVLSVSTHPFAGGGTDDVRITSRYDESNFISGMMSVIHESGHGLYEQNRPHDWRFQPVGTARSMGVHESQSLIFEKQACRSRAFAEYFAPLARRSFGGSDAAWEADNVYRLFTRVERSFIRVDADELTYPAHIIVRYNLEKSLINGGMKVKDLPAAFNDGIKRLLGLTVPDDRNGCLQDIHWYSGGFGYFPSYTLGAMMAAQLFAAAYKARPDLFSALQRGDFAPLREWLKTNIHDKGSLLSENNLMIEATGQALNAQFYLDHLRKRYVEQSER